MPPKRSHDHRILLVSGKLPTKSAIYRMTPEQLRFHREEIAKLSAHGWIGPTYSPICAPTIMVDKRSEGTGERKMRMVVNYREVNALTIVPDFPLPPIQTILEMLGGAQYFSTLDLESGFHQIRMAKEERRKTAFRSVMGLFEYKVMPFGLKGSPVTFQANINAYLQHLLGQGIIAYLDDVLIYSPDGPAPESPTPADPPKPPTSPVLDWPAAHSKCPTFSEPYRNASSKPGEVVQLEFQHCRHTFRYVQPYLRICVNGLCLICVPQFLEFLTHVLYTHHDHVTAGHRGQKKTYLALSKHYYWPGMRSYTNAYVESCTQCRASKSLNQKPAGLLQQLLIPSRRWSHASLDFVTDLPLTAAGHDAILLVVDSLSKMARFIPAKKSHSAADIVELLADRLIRCHGFPDVLVSDRDPRFQSEVWSQLCSRFSITRAMSSSYQPQTDGQTEWVNRTLEQMLRTYIQADEREWEGLLPALELAYSTTSHSSTELSPFEIMIGEKPLTAADLDIVGVLSPTLTPPMTKLFRQLCDRAQSHILQAKWRQKYYADAHRLAVEYKVGDQVWLSSKHLPALNNCTKFESRCRGPFTVTERIGTVAYRLALPPTYEGHNVFHVSQLVPHHSRALALVPQEAPVGWPPTRDDDGNPTDQYLVDYILDQRGTGAEASYLVKWRGFPEEWATWEPAHHLAGCIALLRAWRRRQRNRHSP
ncbi:OSJNBa0087O24.13 protein, related [Eimeria praecox]|uniref:OSJNBa0087O24.13 protein, related n=1 Tax=Eimeria praecox TaxID=51316 RepID=U6H2Q8_9EIME|nr:OSJNBa0087O24.13 protein, related [Eimeria praecox]